MVWITRATSPACRNPDQRGELAGVWRSNIFIPPYHGACAEANVVIKALNAGVPASSLSGANVKVVNIGASGKGHLTPKAPCSSCEALLDRWNINLKNSLAQRDFLARTGAVLDFWAAGRDCRVIQHDNL
ncbi:MAG: hypothetical protein R3B47_06655 [Bacteroidia bacterium]